MAATATTTATATAAFSENKFVTSLKTDPLLRSYQVAAGRGIVCKYYSQPTILFPTRLILSVFRADLPTQNTGKLKWNIIIQSIHYFQSCRAFKTFKLRAST